jgi:hypothetical protein
VVFLKINSEDQQNYNSVFCKNLTDTNSFKINGMDLTYALFHPTIELIFKAGYPAINYSQPVKNIQFVNSAIINQKQTTGFMLLTGNNMSAEKSLTLCVMPFVTCS